MASKLAKKLLPVLLILTLFSGCKHIQKEADDFVSDTKKSIDNVTAEAEKIKKNTTETIDKLQKAGKAVEDATKAIDNATDAIKKVGK